MVHAFTSFGWPSIVRTPVVLIDQGVELNTDQVEDMIFLVLSKTNNGGVGRNIFDNNRAVRDRSWKVRDVRNLGRDNFGSRGSW